MSRSGSAIKLTSEDLLKLPESHQRQELIDGEYYVTPTPVPLHQLVAARVTISLGGFVVAAGCGLLLPSVDVVISPQDLVEPDLLFLSREHLHRIQGKYFTEPPDLVIEVLSPSTRGRDLGIKLRLYERAGVPEYWVLDAVRATARVFRQGPQGYGEGLLLSAANGDALTTPFAPGWSLALAELFAAPA